MIVEKYETPLGRRRRIAVALGNTEHGLSYAEAAELRDRLTEVLETESKQGDDLAIACECERQGCRNYVSFNPAEQSITAHCTEHDGAIVLPPRIFLVLYEDVQLWLRASAAGQ